MYAHAKNPVFSSINILIIQQLLLTLFFNRKANIVEEIREDDSDEDLESSELTFSYLLREFLISDRFKVFFEERRVDVFEGLNCVHSVAGKRARKDVNEPEKRLKWLIHQMRKMVL